MGLLHDLGKYSHAFQSYIKSAQGEIEPEDEDYVDAVRAKAKVDHSTAGAQYIWEKKGGSQQQQLVSELVSLCIASHHSGLIDCLSPVGDDVIGKRMAKPEDRAHYLEVKSRVDQRVRIRVESLLGSQEAENDLKERIELLSRGVESTEIGCFSLGFLARFLFSALIDADRLNSAEREPNPRPQWPLMIDRLEAHLAGFLAKNEIDEIRNNISSSCLKFAAREKGLYQLSVPTGGGKTLASLRFALRHAERHKMDRIVYVVPYTSIIDQNARVARSIFASLKTNGGHVVLEHHSNLTPEKATAENKLLSENWDAPLVYTTGVQLLETLFGSGTRGVRRLHQLANSIIVFDEIQVLPLRVVHLFNNAINFLTGHCGTTVVFCTATQPLLDKVDAKKGAARLSPAPQMMPDVGALFRKMRRTRIEDKCKGGGWTEDEVADLACQLLAEAGSVLIVVNKKAQARDLYLRLYGRADHVYHLSTSMCPVHRLAILDEVSRCLDPSDPLPVICVSTQLIEAGVDVDFGSAIRYLAGLDSVAQTAGRCNRNGFRSMGRVLIVNPASEDLGRLPEIRAAREVALRVLDEYRADPAAFDHDLQAPPAQERYYAYYFFGRQHEMVFPVSSREIGRDGNLLSLLSTNLQSVEAFKTGLKKPPPYLLRQSFMTAAKAFKAIDTETEGVIVPYGSEGRRIIQELCSGTRFEKAFALLKEAQRYSVNLFPNEMKRLKDIRAAYETWEASGIYYLDERHYSAQFGASAEEVSEMNVLIE